MKLLLGLFFLALVALFSRAEKKRLQLRLMFLPLASLLPSISRLLEISIYIENSLEKDSDFLIFQNCVRMGCL